MLVGVGAIAPAHADTGSDLDAARARLSAAQADLDRLTAAYAATEAKLATAMNAADEAERTIGRLERELMITQRALQARTVQAFMDGGTTGTIGTLLAASSFSDLTDRIEFASALVQGDADLATRVQSQQQQLQWARQRFAQAASTQRVELGNLAQQRDQIAAGVDRLAAVVDDLKKQLAAEHQVPDPQPRTNGAIELCPVDGPNSFSDSFGDPRPGGRTHQGIDMFASFGTPIVAVHAGNAVRAPNELGGNAVIVYHDGSSDWTYYAHMSSYGAVGNVSAGTVIGYVGATGDTNTNHLHFEYHPGGGAAVDPYQMLLAVC